MSLITLPEAHHLSTGIEVEGIVKSMEKGNEVWIDYLQNYRRVCNAKLTDGNGNMINIAFWGNDIPKVRNNLKIRITDAKWDTNKKILYKTRIGKIIVSGFNPNLIFHDMEKFKKYHNDVYSIKQYYDYVKSSKSNIYLGSKKLDYLKIIDDFIVLEFAKKRLTRRNNAVSSALFHLHKIVTLTPVRIRQTLGLFGINIEIDNILRISSEWETKRFSSNTLKISHKITHNTRDSIGLEITHSNYSIGEIPEGMTVEDELRDDDSEKPLCEGNSLEFHRKYKGYC
jgi:hypothetical protein